MKHFVLSLLISIPFLGFAQDSKNMEKSRGKHF